MIFKKEIFKCYEMPSKIINEIVGPEHSLKMKNIKNCETLGRPIKKMGPTKKKCMVGTYLLHDFLFAHGNDLWQNTKPYLHVELD